MNSSSINQLLDIESPQEIARVCRVWPEASRLFTTDEAIAEWLKTPNSLFDGETPLAVLRNEEGAERVVGVVVGLTHGSYQ